MAVRSALGALVAVVLVGPAGVWGQGPVAEQVRGEGSWTSDGTARGLAQRWSLHLQRAEDGTVWGLITVRDSPLLRAGRVVGKMEGRTISGTITDEQGRVAVRFTGVVSDRGLRGRYTDRTGETGEWQWEGEFPR